MNVFEEFLDVEFLGDQASVPGQMLIRVRNQRVNWSCLHVGFVVEQLEAIEHFLMHDFSVYNFVEEQRVKLGIRED